MRPAAPHRTPGRPSGEVTEPVNTIELIGKLRTDGTLNGHAVEDDLTPTAEIRELSQRFNDLEIGRIEEALETAEFQERVKITWGAKSVQERGPIIGTLADVSKKNVAGTHGGPAAAFTALAIAHGRIQTNFRPDFTNTILPELMVYPNNNWKDPSKIVTMDPWGAMAAVNFSGLIKEGIDIRPTIAITRGAIHMPELDDAVKQGRLNVDGKILTRDARGDLWAQVTKVVIEPVWYLPGIAKRLNVEENVLRAALSQVYENDRIKNEELKVFLPPVSGSSMMIFGDIEKIRDPKTVITARTHDECNGSDVTGYDICSCRPFLAFGIELGLKTAQNDGVGVILYNYKEARGLGQVTKYGVYNRRLQDSAGDIPANYFSHTESVAGTADARFQELMPDPYIWLGAKRITHWVSESSEKVAAMRNAGIEIVNQVRTPSLLIPSRALAVEMQAKHSYGYDGDLPDPDYFGDHYRKLEV